MTNHKREIVSEVFVKRTSSYSFKTSLYFASAQQPFSSCLRPGVQERDKGAGEKQHLLRSTH